MNQNSITIDGFNINYISEGSGEKLLLIHGTPGFSIEWRHLISYFKENYHCIAPDHLAFGYSDKIENADYSVKAHSERLSKLINQVVGENYTLVCHDFGGQIGIYGSILADKPPKKIIAMNAWLGSISHLKSIQMGYNLFKGSIGKFLYVNYGFSAKFMLPNSYFDKKKLDKSIYKIILDTQKDKISRTVRHKLVLELIEASDIYDKIKDEFSNKLKEIPTYIIWGEEDQFLKKSELLEPWTKLPSFIEKFLIPQCGHYPQEEKPEELIQILENILTK